MAEKHRLSHLIYPTLPIDTAPLMADDDEKKKTDGATDEEHPAGTSL